MADTLYGEELWLRWWKERHYREPHDSMLAAAFTNEVEGLPGLREAPLAVRPVLAKFALVHGYAKWQPPKDMDRRLLVSVGRPWMYWFFVCGDQLADMAPLPRAAEKEFYKGLRMLATMKVLSGRGGGSLDILVGHDGRLRPLQPPARNRMLLVLYVPDRLADGEIPRCRVDAEEAATFAREVRNFLEGGLGRASLVKTARFSPIDRPPWGWLPQWVDSVFVELPSRDWAMLVWELDAGVTPGFLQKVSSAVENGEYELARMRMWWLGERVRVSAAYGFPQHAPGALVALEAEGDLAEAAEAILSLEPPWGITASAVIAAGRKAVVKAEEGWPPSFLVKAAESPGTLVRT